MKIRNLHLGIIVLIMVFGGVAVSAAMNLWATEGSKQPAKFKEGTFEGTANPADIRGSYSFADVKNAFGVPVEDLAKAFAIGTVADPGAFKAKDLEAKYGELAKSQGIEIGTASVRMFVAYYLGLPYTPTGDTWLLEPGAQILKQRGKMTAEQLKYVESHTIKVPK